MLLEQMIPLAIAQEEWLSLFGGLFCLIPLVWFIVAILLCIWVYRDAESRGMSGVLWLIIVLIAGIIGLIIYLIVRKDKTSGQATRARITVNTRTMAAIIVFAALAIVLNLSPLKIPAPYAPFLIYQIWEIPIVTAFLVYGARAGFLITVVNTLALFVIYPGALPTGPLYNLAAVLSMLLGLGISKALIDRHSLRSELIIAALLTASGVVLRTLAMTLVNYVFLRFPTPIGYSLPEEAIIATIPLVVMFNATLALYTIPVGYSLARTVKFYTKS
jgi:riboflavin transporter FmnP